jgi:hypothetical protein
VSLLWSCILRNSSSALVISSCLYMNSCNFLALESAYVLFTSCLRPSSHLYAHIDFCLRWIRKPKKNMQKLYDLSSARKMKRAARFTIFKAVNKISPRVRLTRDKQPGNKKVKSWQKLLTCHIQVLNHVLWEMFSFSATKKKWSITFRFRWCRKCKGNNSRSKRGIRDER